MNTDHPSLRSLTLVLPGHLNYDQVLQGLVQAVEDARTSMAEFTRRSQRRENEYATRGDGYRTALCRGQAQAGEYAVDAIDEAIAAAFDLWYQIDATLGRYDQDANGPSPELPGPPRPPRPR
jgi:hypothetical protein